MNNSLSISLTGLKGLQQQLDSVSNNVANVNTTGYKKKDTVFQELLLNDVTGTVDVSANANDIGINRGVQVSQSRVNVSQGGLVSSKGLYDLAISGQGFFGVRGADNQLVLTRDGGFGIDQTGLLHNSSGDRLEVDYLVPQGQWPAGSPSIREDGTIFMGDQAVGKVLLFTVDNPNQLQELGNNKYGVNGAVLRTSQMSSQGFGTIKQGYLESSTVDLAESMSDMIITQRAYSMNAKVMQATDEMMQRVNEFKQ
ncbi:flagellar hook-basal body protein [Vagococcus sp. BWB3-3]|uniref:Flagellar hook-basal body protein n=1 Tax=Vagococcus allomyrinae TaxID=2794353 RepID=A0A940SV70_9ENTE|nr:flagellar hook-basal body protein [Vagococcus allomyrinae]MBP1042030.1 flagellar hook-basal body protein [Vagococcus allomyrinae]